MKLLIDFLVDNSIGLEYQKNNNKKITTTGYYSDHKHFRSAGKLVSNRLVACFSAERA